MAYLFDPNQDEDENQQGQGPEKLVSGEGGVITGGNAGGGQTADQQAAGKPTKSGSWTNLQNYLGANKGADARMGAEVKGTVDKAAQGYQTAAQDFEQKANTAADQATVRDSGVVGKIQAIGEGKGAQGVDKSAYERQATAAYTGPKQSTDLMDEWNKSYQASNQVQNFGKMAQQGESGRQGLLGEVYGKQNQYRQGERALDDFVLSGNTEGARMIQDVGQQYSNYGKNFQDLTGKLDQRFQKAGEETAKTRDDTMSAVEKASQALKSRFDAAQGQADQQNTSAADLYSRATKGDAAALKALGYDDGSLGYLQSMGYDFGRGVEKGGGYGIGDYAAAGDVGGYGELMGLLGAQGTYDFNAKGGKATAGSAAQIAAAKDAAAREAALQAKLKQANDARQSQFGSLANQFVSFDGPSDQALQQLGISRDDYALARENGLSPGDFLQAGRKLTAGDVLQGQDRSAYEGLLQTLGLDTSRYADQGDEGTAYGFDSKGFGGKVQAIKDERARIAAEKAAQEALAAQAAAAPGAVESTMNDPLAPIKPYLPPVPTMSNPTPSIKVSDPRKRW